MWRNVLSENVEVFQIIPLLRDNYVRTQKDKNRVYFLAKNICQSGHRDHMASSGEIWSRRNSLARVLG